ncbi:NAD+ synthase [Desulfogranum mediterraneum]|uniref:NAD+ synthase n=1 Tax=Desulfogranum mediterraneum TaxID=160661 RepID=UPI0003FC86B4|nr:NAD+ synthase [Desulfogranum mediterraneum]
MKIALVQTNPIIGAFDRNLEKILSWLGKARAASCDLVIFPELALCGYPPQDLLERPSFIRAHERALERLIEAVTDITCVIGVLEPRTGVGKALYNSAFVIEQRQVLHRARKQLLPTYDVFDESRYFEPGTESTVFCCQGLHFGLSVCEDIWSECQSYPVNPLNAFVIGSVVPDGLINISASPYYHHKLEERRAVFSQLCRQNNYPLLYVNQVGGQDTLVFDGHSLVVNTQGEVIRAGQGFVEDMVVVESDQLAQGGDAAPVDGIEQVRDALVLGVRDYLHKTGFSKAVVGLSGGIDSAVTAALACTALGPENVLCVAMPSPYTSQASVDDARALSERFGCGFECLEIAGLMEGYQHLLEPLFLGLAEDVTEQNVQARIRGNLLMAISNKMGGLLLSTGNKSEMAVGYCTLYGDMSGGLAVLADVPKDMVYQLARLYNRDQELIPERIITRPPTAELKPEQCDQDDLPPYEILDPILEAYLERHQSVEQMVEQGFERATVEDIVRRVNRNEYKRKQAPLGIKVTSKAFGPGRRYPVVQSFQE